MVVVDSSVVVAALTEGASRGATAREALRRAESLHAPHLMDLEVVSAIRRLVRGKALLPEDAGSAITDLPGMPIRRYEHTPFLTRIWSSRDNVTSYDAAYVALAEALDATVVTTDGRLTRAAGARCGFRLLTD